MYELHGWFGLADSPYESDTGSLQPLLNELGTLLAGFELTNAHVALLPLNGAYFLTVTALTNHKDSRAEAIEQIVCFIYQRLPGSYSLLYEWNDETDDPPGHNAFRVRVITRGQVVDHTDPFLSPRCPTIED